MRKEIPIQSAMFVVAMILAGMASAETETEAEAAIATAPEADATRSIKLSASAGLGYDSNAYQVPGASYVDYAALPPGSNPTVNPQKKSGFFIPYKVRVDVTKRRDQDNRRFFLVAVDERIYIGSGLNNANESNADLSGGAERVLRRDGDMEDTFYFGVLGGKHKQVYVEHDSGLEETTASGIEISGRYSYINLGAEAKYKHRIGDIDYGISGQYILNDYENPAVGPSLDHAYYTLGADASLPIATRTSLNLSFNHSVRDYSKLSSRDALGNSGIANPLLMYTYDAVGATLLNRISDVWLLYADFDHTQRADNNVGYGDSGENRYGVRVMYEQGLIKARLAMHHWARDYPNGFAFDVSGQGAKSYRGYNLKFRAEREQTQNTALWTELVYDGQSSADPRYEYARTQAMAGMSWVY